MYQESFSSFIEIIGLKNRIDQHQKAINSEKKRISDLLRHKEASIAKISTLEYELHQLNTKEFELILQSNEERLAHLKGQTQMARNEKEAMAFTHEIDLLQKKLAQDEVTYFKNEERSEEIKKEIHDLKNFIQGLLTSATEIQNDVDINIKKEENEISNYEKRIHSLLEHMPPNAKNIFEETSKKFKHKSPCSFIINHICHECKISVDRETEHLASRQETIEFCPNCGRILLCH